MFYPSDFTPRVRGYSFGFDLYLVLVIWILVLPLGFRALGFGFDIYLVLAIWLLGALGCQVLPIPPIQTYLPLFRRQTTSRYW